MLAKTVFKLIGLLFVLNLLAGCPANKPTQGDLMMNQGPHLIDVGTKWNEGNKLVQFGNDMIAQGRDNVNEGNKLISKGNIQITEGNKLIEQGKKLISESENDYRQRVNSVPPPQPAVTPVPVQPADSTEVFPLED